MILFRFYLSSHGKSAPALYSDKFTLDKRSIQGKTLSIDFTVPPVQVLFWSMYRFWWLTFIFFPVAAFLRKRRWTKYPMQQFFALKVYEWRAQLEINGPKEFLYHREMRPNFFAGLHYERKLEERVKQDRKVRNCENCFSRNDLCRSPHWLCAFVSFSGVYFWEVKLGAKPTSLDPRLHLL